MKKNYNYLVIFLLGCLVMISCKKKENSDPLTFPYANESVDKGKSNLENTGSQMLTEMKTLESADGLQVIANFNNLTTTAAPFSAATVLLAPVSNTNNLVGGKNILYQLRAGLAESSDTTIQQEFNRYKGVYTWNFTSKKWDKSLATDRIEFNFPSTKTGTTNNAKMVVTYQGIAGISIIDGYHGDMPAKFNNTLYVNNIKLAEYDLTASYNSDGTPASVVYFVALYPFKFQVSLTYNAASSSVKYSFTDNSKIIVECYAAVNGKLDKKTLESDNTEEIINNANAYFQVLNIKLVGQVNYKGLYDADNTIKGNTKYTEIQADSAAASALNKNMSLVLVYADTKQKIAQGEFYPSTKVNTWTDYLGHAHSNTESYVDYRFVFADKSKGDLKTYFSEGFQDLVNDINNFIIKINTDFESDLKPIEYGSNN
jgi:hypothetical protein